MPTLLKSIAIAVAAAAAVALASFAVMGGSPGSGDVSPATLDSLAVNAILEGTVVAGPESSEAFMTYQQWQVRVESIPYDRGEYQSRAYARTVSQPVPKEGQAVWIAVPRELSLDVGSTYAFYAGRAYFPDPKEQEKWPWQAALVLSASDGYAPTPGTQQSLVDGLDAIRLGSETNVEALTEFASDYAAFLDSRNRGESPELSGRLETLAVTRSGRGVEPAAEWLHVMSHRPPQERQLPTDKGDLDDFTRAGIEQAFTVTEWTPWLVVILLDEQARGTSEWFGLYIDDVGFLGPVGAGPGDQVVELVGYGPPTGSVELMRWGSGTPAEVIADRSTVPDIQFASRETKLGTVDTRTELARQRDTNDVLLIVDLRAGGESMKLASVAEANKMIVELLGESEPRSEGAPTQP